MTLRHRFIFLALIATALQTACGFQLRSLPGSPGFDDIRIQGTESGSELVTALKSRIRALDGRRPEPAKTATLTLDIRRFVLKRDIHTRTADGGIAEYVLEGLVEYALLDAAGHRLADDTIEQRIIFIRDPDNPLADDRKEQMLKAELRRDLVQGLLDMLTARRHEDAAHQRL